MALYYWHVNNAMWQQLRRDDQAICNAVAYAGTLHVAARMAGDKRVRIMPIGDSLKQFVGQHVAGACVQRAIGAQQPPRTLLLDDGGAPASRWARSVFTPALRLAIDSDVLLDAETEQPDERPPPVLCALVTHTNDDNEVANAAAELLTLGSMGTSAVGSKGRAVMEKTSIMLPPVFVAKGSSSSRSKGRKRTKSTTATEQQEGDEFEADDDFTGYHEGDEAMEDNAPEAKRSKREPEPHGYNLEELRDADDAESIGTYDVTDGFVVHDDSTTDETFGNDDDESFGNDDDEEDDDKEDDDKEDNDKEDDDTSGEDLDALASADDRDLVQANATQGGASDDDDEVRSKDRVGEGSGTDESDKISGDECDAEPVIIDVMAAAAAEKITHLRRVNPVPEFDGKAQLYERDLIRLADGTVMKAVHTYVVEGAVGYTSTTTVVGQWLDPFDAPRISLNMVTSRNWITKTEYRGPAESWATEALRKKWQDSTFAGDVAQWPKTLATAAAMFRQDLVGWHTLRSMMTDHGGQSKAVADGLHEQWQYLCAEQIQATWTRNAELGTAMHERIEEFYEGTVPRSELQAIGETTEPELLQFLRWHDEWLVPRGYEPFRMEMRVFDRDLRISGSIDAVFRHRDTGHLIMVDWKRSKEIHFAAFRGKTGKGPLAAMPDANFTRYTMQQNMYKFMLEKHTPLRLQAMYLLICHPNQGTDFNLIPVPDKPTERQGICQKRMEEMNTVQ